MRRPYSIPTDRLRSGAINSAPGLQRGAQTERRVSLVTVQEEIQLPAHHGLVAVRRLKVLRIEQTSLPIDRLLEARPPIAAQTPGRKQIEAATHRGLPPRQPEPELECQFDGRSVRLRNVHEIMTDDAGNFYEVNGGQLRPLGELVRDEHGRIFEVRPSSDSPAAEAAKEKLNESSSGHAQSAHGSTVGGSNPTEALPRPASAPAARKETSFGYHKICADPGLYLKLPWASVKSELAAQIRHPEKLRDDDEVECYAQIYEAERTLPAAHIADAEIGDGALHSQLHPLTREKAQALGVPELFRPTRYPFETRASSRQIHAGQRVYRLWPVFDPTVHRVANPVGQPAEQRNEQRTLLSQIPEQYLNSMYFKYSREEVLYDMKSPLGTLPPDSSAFSRRLFIYPLRFLKALLVSITSYRRVKKWRTMLEGKSPDEQLWTVTPPRGFSYHPRVRRWAEDMLASAGYDPGNVLIEWEIFWRRKNVEAS